MPSRIGRYLVTAGVLCIGATLFSMWRAACTPSCELREVVFGYPVFLRTPFSPDSPGGPVFMIIPFLVNVFWAIGVAISFWAVVDTWKRWRDRRQQPFV